MRASPARATKNSVAPAKAKVLPPARAFAKARNAKAPKLVRLGATQARREHGKFPLPKEFRRSTAGNHSSPAVSLNSTPEHSVRANSLISAAGLLDALANLPKRAAAPERQPIAMDLHPWSFPDADADTAFQGESTENLTGVRKSPAAIIQFAQLPSNQVIAPPVLPLHRPLGKPVGPDSLKRIASTSIRSTGAQLRVAVKDSLPRTFSVDLTPIRVHPDASAQGLARSLSPRAFAYGN